MGDDFLGLNEQTMSKSTLLSTNILPVGMIMEVEYDFGSTTKLYLKVLRHRRSGVRRVLDYGRIFVQKWSRKDLSKVPAYNLASQAFLGRYVPILANNCSQDDQAPSHPVAVASMGLCSKVTGELDTTFAFVENAHGSADMMYCGPVFADLNEFLATADESWTPRDPEHDPDELHRRRYDGVCRHIFPTDDTYQERYDQLRSLEDDPEYAMFCAKNFLHRGATATKDFAFVKSFPKTAAQLTSGKFRWFQYRRGVLRVLVGRNSEHRIRSYDDCQILGEWEEPFSSFHELLCAVEASWCYKGKPLGADTVLPEFDKDLSPSNPLPKEPPSFGRKEDCVLIHADMSEKLVTAMKNVNEALADGSVRNILYSGHHDGTLVKWNLVTNEKIWEKQIYEDRSEGWEHPFVYYGRDEVLVRATPGVSGMQVIPHEADGHHIYTWSDGRMYNVSKHLLAWRAEDCNQLHDFNCDIGFCEEGGRANPYIATVILTSLCYEEQWHGCVLVGLHCIAPTLDVEIPVYGSHLEKMQEFTEGNILPRES